MNSRSELIAWVLGCGIAIEVARYFFHANIVLLAICAVLVNVGLHVWNTPGSRGKTAFSAAYTQTTLTPTLAILLELGKKVLPLVIEAAKKLIPKAV